MKTIIDQLKECIRLHPSVVYGSIGVNATWNRTQCIILSQIISEALLKATSPKESKKNKANLTISGMTLQRIFNDGYTEKENPDLRFLKTLDKLAIFLGHSSLNDFLAHQKQQEAESNKAQNKPLPEGFEKLILNHCFEEFKCLKMLPNINLTELTNYTFEDSPLTKRITDALHKYADLNFRVNTTDNRSNFEVYDFKMISSDENLVVLSAKEFWNIQWTDESNNPVRIYNKINRQTYFIKKRDGVWKIWDNHNPDYNGLIADVEETHFQQNILI
ncbi:MAG TPA: hypothetical protein VLB74_03020 [Flavobacterium sp.]|uniref:hypothetical protein n=1 Tax=Flavobacterium sp. TaxID=239 RepID=UPI002B54964C|nr:hypothetical protein [Flavobacterium sp.]HSD13600.1 hypothetical protein [Flavobacterium sp.]